MALSLALPSLPPGPSSFLAEGERRAPLALWGEDVDYGGHRDPLARFSSNVSLAHVLPIAVRPDAVESFMASKALQSDVGSLMPMSHNTKRRVPRHQTPAVFPRNNPERVDHFGRPVLTRPTRESLERCTDNLYVSPWSSRAHPDLTQEARRTHRLQQRPKLLLKRSQVVHEPEPNFCYTTVYRESYSKHSLAEDQDKIYLPPIQRKTSYINEPEEETGDETAVEDDIHQKVQEEQGPDEEDNVDVRPLPYCESLVNIRSRLRGEGWALPNIYTKWHPLHDEEYFPCESRQVRPQRLPSPTVTESRPPKSLISCDPGNLTNSLSQRPASSKHCSEAIRSRCTNVAQTQIIYDRPMSTQPDKPNRSELDKLPRRVSFKSNQPEVSTFRPASPLKPFFSRRHVQTTPEVYPKEDPDEELGTDEMISAGCRRRSLLPRLQIRDLKTVYQARQHERHVETVPDLRDNATYSKRVGFYGYNSSVYRG